MDLNQLTAISPIDGRYRNQIQHLDEYFSEYALIKYRVLVEVEYFLFLAEKKFFKLDARAKQQLQKTTEDFSLADAKEIKETEAITNHDVKAVEYFIKKVLDKCKAGHLKEWVHFGLTSQDIRTLIIPPSLYCGRTVLNWNGSLPSSTCNTASVRWRWPGKMYPCWLVPMASPPAPQDWEKR
jgi:adenylosuccinate lyase